jgi:predicted GNAT family N-acyltransferase
MEITVNSYNYASREECKLIFDIREKVFVQEQQVSREEEFDQYEQSSLHYLGRLDNIPAGTARWRITENGIKLERFAVLTQFRNHGVAAAILNKVVKDILLLNKKIYLHAQVSAVAFYEKYGFKKEGPIFSEANIDHFKMYYDYSTI